MNIRTLIPKPVFLIAIIFCLGCNNEDDKLPSVSTVTVSHITQQTGVSGGNINSAGASEITQRGICWSEKPNPDINGKLNIDIYRKTGSFTGLIKELKKNTVYHVRAFASNSYGTAYGQDIAFTTSELPTDFDGNIYDTIKIGSQVWFKQNLKTAHYSNGDPIPKITVDSVWKELTEGGYHTGNDTMIDFAKIYGHLYNGYAVKDPRKLCPDGWHVSSDFDWSVMTTYIGGDYFAGGKLKEKGTSHWLEPNLDATDEYGFTALPAGGYSCISCTKTGEIAVFWSIKPSDDKLFTFRIMSRNEYRLITSWGNIESGMSVRCVKD